MEPLKKAACGLDCNGCDIYRLDTDISVAERFVDWFRSIGVIGPEEGAAEIMAKGPHCKGCHGDRKAHWSGDCSILTCCVDENGLDSCGKCGSFVCRKLDDWASRGAKYMKALDGLKAEKGV